MMYLPEEPTELARNVRKDLQKHFACSKPADLPSVRRLEQCRIFH